MADHEYVVPAIDEVRVTSVDAVPEHMVCTKGEFVTTGNCLTVTVLVAVFLQPVAVIVPVGTYEVVDVG